MLINAITNAFENYFGQDPKHDTVLWFDPSGEWRALLPYLRPHLPRLIHEEGLLHIRYLLGQRTPGERVVVYLPMAKEKAIYLRPYFYTAKCYRASIEQVLHRAGATLPDDRQVRELLPTLAVASVGKGAAFWQGIVNAETALGRLMPDFDEMLLRFLAAPRQTLAELQQAGTTQPFFERAKIQFDLTAPEQGHEEAWADRFTALLCLVEVRAANPNATGFPFEDVLPHNVTWGQYRSLLHKWQHHELFKAAFKQRAKALDSQYRLDHWIAELPLETLGSSFLNIEQALWQRMQARLEALKDKRETIAFAKNYQPAFAQRAATFWAREGEVPGWQALLGMSETLAKAQRALNEVDKQPTLAAMVARYAAEWWRADAAYRRFRTQLDRTAGHLDAALKWTVRIYQDYLEAINERFTQVLAQEARWPPEGYGFAGSALWQGPTSTSRGKRALVMVDALRYELAHDLATRLDLGEEAVRASVSPLPSVTELGMAALLPEWESFRVEYDEAWIIQAPENAGNLARKDKRLAWLTAHLGNTKVFDLDQWLATPLNADVDTQAAEWIVLTSQAIDAAGEGIGTVALHTFDTLLERLEHGIRRLMAAGCTEIHIVTDHGFLLREAVRDADKVRVKEPGLLKKNARYAVGRGDGYTAVQPEWAALPHLPIPGSHDLTVWLPRGIGCFMTPGPYNYMHGGGALQEVVIPVLHIRQTVMERPVDVTLEILGGTEIRNAIFKIRLHPVGANLLSLPRRVEIDIVKQGQRVSRVWEAKVERDIVEKSLMLEWDYGLIMGDEVQIRVRDATTGEVLDAETVTVNVDLDL